MSALPPGCAAAGLPGSRAAPLRGMEKNSRLPPRQRQRHARLPRPHKPLPRFQGTPLEDIKRGNLAELFAYAFWYMSL